MDPSELERKLLNILSEDELDPSAEVRPEAIGEAFPYLDDKAKKIMGKIFTAELPSPEEIEEAGRLAEHNAGVQRKRDEDLRRRKINRRKKK